MSDVNIAKKRKIFSETMNLAVQGVIRRHFGDPTKFGAHTWCRGFYA